MFKIPRIFLFGTTVLTIAFATLTYGCGGDETTGSDLTDTATADSADIGESDNALPPDEGNQADAGDDSSPGPDADDAKTDANDVSPDEGDTIEPDGNEDPDISGDADDLSQDAAREVSDADDDVATDTQTGDATQEWVNAIKLPGIEIAGEWTDEWGTSHDIASMSWLQEASSGSSLFLISDFDPANRFAVAQNDATNQWSPGLWSRFDWTSFGGETYFCQTAFAAATVEEARNASPADPTDPTASGCGGFAWTKLTKRVRLAIAGRWVDSWGSSHSINDAVWTQSMGDSGSAFAVVTVDNENGVVIARNSDDNEWNGGKWSRFDWTWFNGDLYFCQTAYAAETREEAENTPAADPTDPTTTGCGGFGWTMLSAEDADSDTVTDAPGHTGTGIGNSANAVNGIRGGGASTGSTDVFSLGYTVDADNYIVLEWSGSIVTDGPGPDFVVFENGFSYGGSNYFMDLIVVMVSRDGLTWVPFPFDYTAGDETRYSPDPAMWSGFAGVTPVLYNVEANPVDPFDHALAGGDQFDLADLPDSDPDAVAIKTYGFTFLKLLSAATVINPDTGVPFPHDPVSNGPDIDGVIARNVRPTDRTETPGPTERP